MSFIEVEWVSVTYGKIIISIPLQSLRSVDSFQKSPFRSQITFPSSSSKTESYRYSSPSLGARVSSLLIARPWSDVAIWKITYTNMDLVKNIRSGNIHFHSCNIHNCKYFQLECWKPWDWTFKDYFKSLFGYIFRRS